MIRFCALGILCALSGSVVHGQINLLVKYSRGGKTVNLSAGTVEFFSVHRDGLTNEVVQIREGRGVASLPASTRALKSLVVLPSDVKVQTQTWKFSSLVRLPLPDGSDTLKIQIPADPVECVTKQIWNARCCRFENVVVSNPAMRNAILFTGKRYNRTIFGLALGDRLTLRPGGTLANFTDQGTHSGGPDSTESSSSLSMSLIDSKDSDSD